MVWAKCVVYSPVDVHCYAWAEETDVRGTILRIRYSSSGFFFEDMFSEVYFTWDTFSSVVFSKYCFFALRAIEGCEFWNF